MADTEILAATPEHPLKDGKVHLLGAVDVVTGAMTRVEIAGASVLVDCGIGQGREEKQWKFPEAARDVDAVLLTHGHLDHIGSLPRLLDDAQFDKPIFATRATLDIARISLEDTLEMARLSSRDIAWLLGRFDQLARPVGYDVAQHHDKLPLQFAFREAGHILGSASVELVSAQSRVIISGDLGRPNSPILRDANTTWSADKPVDVVVMESTYGELKESLCGFVNDAVDAHGKIFIPAFAIGRTQLLLYFLNELFEEKRIPHVPVALDTPMGVMVTETYQRSHKLFDKEALSLIQRGDDPLNFDDLFVVKRGRESARLREAPGPMIIIAGSGMCNGGRIIGHLVDGLPDPKNTLLFVGYQGHGTPGRRIQEASVLWQEQQEQQQHDHAGHDHSHAPREKRGSTSTRPAGTVWLDNQEVPVRARIATLSGLSAHADRTELLQWVRAIPNVKRIALHHGDRAAQEDFVQFAARTSART
jgi:metallo-beta-lactamase family protein